MDFRTFLWTTETLVSELEGGLRTNWLRTIRSLLHHGEEGMAVDQLILALIKDEVPVTPSQRDTLIDLINYFGPLDDELLHHVPNLMTASIDWLTVVEGQEPE